MLGASRVCVRFVCQIASPRSMEKLYFFNAPITTKSDYYSKFIALKFDEIFRFFFVVVSIVSPFYFNEGQITLTGPSFVNNNIRPIPFFLPIFVDITIPLHISIRLSGVITIDIKTPEKRL